jgi:hypothetical protein
MKGADAPGRPTSWLAAKRLSPIAVLLVLLISIAVAWAWMGTVSYRLATATARSDFHLLARLDGVLAAQANTDGTACFWVGKGPDRTALFWPWGYAGRGSPVAAAFGWTPANSLTQLAVYDEAGSRLAGSGQRVSMAGGSMGDEVHSIRGCSGFPRYFVVGEIATNK